VTVEDGIAYYNCGSWCEQPCVYLTILDGCVEAHHFDAEPTLFELVGSEAQTVAVSA
jgi:hypothetical protein